MHKEFIDLGCGLESTDSPMPSSPSPAKKSYPCFYFTCDEHIELPDGDFTFMAKGRQIKHSEDTRDPDEPRFTYEIEVQGFKPMGGAKKDGPDLSSKLKEGMRKSMAKGEYEEED